jgi:hypothetical protein
MTPFYIAVEGDTDEAVAQRIMYYLGYQKDALIPIPPKGGKTELKKSIRSYNEAARISPWFVLTDLDSPDRCPVHYAREWLPEPNPNMVFRIAVPQIEAWLLASRTALAKYLQISVDLIPDNPEKLQNPKIAMVNLATRSRSRSIREDISRPNGLIGPAYVKRIGEFVWKYWDIDEAMIHAESLRRCVQALRQFSII